MMGLGAVTVGSRWYILFRHRVAGLDRIAVGLASFLVAIVISLTKAGVFRPWPGPSRRRARFADAESLREDGLAANPPPA